MDPPEEDPVLDELVDEPPELSLLDVEPAVLEEEPRLSVR